MEAEADSVGLFGHCVSSILDNGKWKCGFFVSLESVCVRVRVKLRERERERVVLDFCCCYLVSDRLRWLCCINDSNFVSKKKKKMIPI